MQHSHERGDFSTMKKKPKDLSAESLLLSSLSLFFVFFVWSFFDEGVSNLGINMSIFLGLILAFFISIITKHHRLEKEDFLWIAPLGIIAASYALFENEFTRLTSLFVFFFSGLFTAGHLTQGYKDSEKRWNISYVLLLFLRHFNSLKKLGSAVTATIRLFRKDRPETSVNSHSMNRNLSTRIFTGSLLFLAFAGFIVVPLFSAADSDFGSIFGAIPDFISWLFEQIFSTAITVRILVAFILFSFFGAFGSIWNEKDTPEKIKPYQDDLIWYYWIQSHCSRLKTKFLYEVSVSGAINMRACDK